MSRNTGLLVPVVRDKCEELIRIAGARGMKLIVTSTLRTQAGQRALYAQGRRTIEEVNALRIIAAMPPIKEGANRRVTGARTSMHQFGCAFDIALVKDGRADWDDTASYEEIGRIGESLGLKWGGRSGSRDMCHFEFTGGLSIKELMAGMRPDIEKMAGISAESVNEKEEEIMQMTKAGHRSTEFYMAILGAVLPVLNTHLGLDIPVSGVVSISGVVVSYILARTVIKKAA